MSECATCHVEENFPEDPKSELRPYGPGGSLICFRCAFKDEESTKTTEQNFEAVMEASIAATGVFIIGLPSPKEGE